MKLFAHFGSDLDNATKAVLDHGRKVRAVLVQPQYQSRSVEEQVISLFALKNGFTKQIPVDHVVDFINQLYEDIRIHHEEYLTEIAEKKVISDELNAKLKEVMSAYVDQYLKTIDKEG